ncbi:hypothetical protein QZH41_018172 [Actinostola sp. cb2023]|nr:hypothetical protein QZH41_018172 [Actinostola sp. cb2023]
MKFISKWLPLVTIVFVWAQLPHPSSARVAAPMSEYADVFDFDAGSKDDAPKGKYAIMFDAGSSGTRVKVYRYVQRRGGLQVSDFQELDVPKPNKVRPGLSSFAKNTSAIGDYLKPLLEGAKKVVPDNQESSTTLRIFATAGMRLLDKKEIRAIIDEVDSLLTNKDINTFLYKRGNTKVISGQDEAIYDWVTVNFLKGAFSGKSKGKTYGALDMGGASHQNAFKIGKKDLPSVHLNIAGKPYYIYAHSYLGFGEKEARTTFLEKLVESQVRRRRGSNIIFSPCHNYGITRTIKVKGKTYEIRGAFYRSAFCDKLIKRWFFCDKCAYKDQPQLVGDFYSFSVFNHAFKGTGVVSRNDEEVTMKMINSRVFPFCIQRSDQLDFKADAYADLRCFQLNYIRALLKYGYRVNWSKFRLHNAGSLNGFELNWTVGAMLLNNKLI